MNIVAVNFGSYPRIGDKPAQQGLLGAERLRAADLDRARQEIIRDILAEQARAGLDAVSDGRVRWSDPVSHIMGRLANTTAGRLHRYFDTGTMYRQPVVAGPVGLRDASLIADEVKWAVAVSTRPVAASMPGPLTLSRLCAFRGSAYASPDALMDALVPVLAEEVERLAATGAWGLVIEEPALLREPGAFPRLNDALEMIAARRGGLKLWFFPSSGDAGALWENLQGLPVDGLVVDLTHGTAAAEAVESMGSRLPLLLGIVNTRSVKMESPARIAAAAARLLGNVRAPMAGLVPSGALEALPRDAAQAKCRVLARARDILRGRSRAKPPRAAAARRGAKHRRGRK